MSRDRIRAVVVQLYDGDYTERAWVVATMSEGTWEAIGAEDFEDWKRKALDMVLADWRDYEIREVWLDVPQSQLDDLFAAPPITVEVSQGAQA
jgi:gamma-glutamyltranspeptidase